MTKNNENNVNKEFTFTDNDFHRIAGLIYQTAGIALAVSKKEMVYSRVSRRLRSSQFRTFDTYITNLENNPHSDEWQHFVNALTTNLTAFFREEHHFPILSEYLKQHDKPIKIWCCAASTGEEPYSIAITACETFGTNKQSIEIIATDIDTQVLATASDGIYQMDRLSKIRPELLRKYFFKGKQAQLGLAKVKPELRQMIEFRSLNLLDDSWDLEGPFDIIFCRNVMIYFDKATQSKILRKFEPYLKKGGLLFAGHSENFSYLSTAYKLEGKTVYSKIGT